ncbi:hypothetical protein LBMAG53_28600 [Planctomycetota bacterium]|nr:hypothetical protein LBMAG53_28600 [Planctomycetota bacterium]
MRAIIIAGLPVLFLCGAELPPCPQPIPGFVAPAAGEHPRLFFRKSELGAIKAKAATEDGKKIVARLRLLLDGANGDELPEGYNDCPKIEMKDHAPSSVENAAHGKAFTLWHAAGYGMLWQLTGEKKYADLGKQCAEKMFDGQRDRDSVYSYFDPGGALRAGPSIGAMAMAYDLNYDGWDEAFRKKVASSLSTFKGQKAFTSLPELARGARHNPPKNHWGGQVGGAALALLAIKDDPGVENTAEIAKLLEINKDAMRRQLDEGYSEFGFQSEGQGPGSITSDTAYVPALQAWRVAGGQDYIGPRPRASWIVMLKVHDLFLINGSPWLFNRNMGYGPSYGVGNYAANGERKGLSRGGQWAQGFGAMDDKYKGAALWCYNHILEKDEDKRNFDTVSYYPHRAVLSLINWPFGLKEQNPAEVLPKLIRDSNGYVTTRNGWTGAADCGVSLLSKTPIMAWGLGIRMDWGAWGGPTASFWEDRPDGSFSFSNDKGESYLAVDFSKKSGADMLVVVAGKALGKDGNLKGPEGTALATTHTIGGKPVQVITFAKGKQPERAEAGDAVTVGGEKVSFDGVKISVAW